ncbi:MAG TPA: biopolymer transporter ExbD [Rhizomicrobium sp.]|jgi:biopolymer transport protein ExbD|nr:biopolymer transporter ExbD [Rhizomicrobium sp.]
MSIDAMHSVPDDEAQLNIAINTTPLVDVMLVMLIIFLVTIPVVVDSVNVKLPEYRNIVTVTKPENIIVSVTKDEGIYWNNDKAPIDPATLRYRLVNSLYAAQAAHRPFPEVHIRGDQAVRFEAVGRVILACQEAGILKVGFLTEPQGFENSNAKAVSSLL